MDLVFCLRDAAARAGLGVMGFASAAPFPGVLREIGERVASGQHGGMRFTYAHPARATDPRASFSWAESLVVAAQAYLPAAGAPGPASPGSGRVARFATEDHYRPLRAGLEALAGVLEAAGHRAAVLCDDARLVDRAAAVRAGVGWWGKNAMVLAPGDGPWLLLGSVVTDASLPHDTPMTRDCGTCAACLPACPTGALVAPGILDARRCLAALAQSPGAIPREFRRRHGRPPLRVRRLPRGLPAGPAAPGVGRRHHRRDGWTCSPCWRPTMPRCCGASPTSTSRSARSATCAATPWWPWATPGERGRWRPPPAPWPAPTPCCERTPPGPWAGWAVRRPRRRCERRPGGRAIRRWRRRSRAALAGDDGVPGGGGGSVL